MAVHRPPYKNVAGTTADDPGYSIGSFRATCTVPAQDAPITPGGAVPIARLAAEAQGDLTYL